MTPMAETTVPSEQTTGRFVRRRLAGNVEVVPRAGARATGADLISTGGDLGMGDSGSQEAGNLTAGLGGEQVRGQAGDDAVTGLAPGEGVGGNAAKEGEIHEQCQCHASKCGSYRGLLRVRQRRAIECGTAEGKPVTGGEARGFP